MAGLYPESGGVYNYLYHSLGSAPAFICVLTVALATAPSAMAVLALTTADYTLALAFRDDCGPPPDVLLKLAAILVIR